MIELNTSEAVWILKTLSRYETIVQIGVGKDIYERFAESGEWDDLGNLSDMLVKKLEGATK